MKGCGVLVCPGTKFCSRLQSFVLRGSAECRWDRGESSQTEVMTEREKGNESGFALCILIEWTSWCIGPSQRAL